MARVIKSTNGVILSGHSLTLPVSVSMRGSHCACDITGVYKTEVLVWRLVICGVIWTPMSAWRWETRVWEVNGQ